MKKILASLRFLFRRRLKITSDVVHVKINDFHYTVTKEDLANYRHAVANSLVNDDTTALHPLFFTKLSWHIIKNLNSHLKDPINDYILKTIVHQSEQIFIYKKYNAPIEFVIKSRIWRIGPHKKGTKMLIRFDYYANNELYVTQYSGGLLFGVKCVGALQSIGELPKTEKIEAPPQWEESIKIDKILPYTYAEKAEIDAPIHTNPAFAKSIGLPDIILQGTCTFAKSVNLIVAKHPDYKLEDIKFVSAKFTGMLVVPNQITVRILKRKEKKVYFDVLNKKAEAVIKGGQILFH